MTQQFRPDTRAFAWNAPLIVSLLLMGAAVYPAVLHAQEAPQTNGKAEPLTLEGVQARLAQIQENAAIEETLKAKIVESYTSALEQLRLEQDRRQKAQQFEQDRLQTPERLKEIEARLAQPAADAPTPPKDATAAELNQMLVQAEAELAAAQKNKEELTREPARRAERRKQIPGLITEAARRLEETQAQLAMPADPTQSQELQEARRILARARIQANEAEKEACEKELRSYEARSQLLTHRQDEAARLVSEREKAVMALRDLVAVTRAQEAQQAAEKAEEAAARVKEASPIVRDITRQLAEENGKLVEARTGVDGSLRRIEADTRALEDVRKELTQVKADFETVKNTVEKQRLRGTVGILLREHRQKLRKRGVDKARVRNRWETIERTEYELLDYQKRRQELADINGRIQEELAELAVVLDENDKEDLEGILRELYTAKRSSLDALISDCNDYIDLLIQMQLDEQEFANEIGAFSAYIEKHILWIRSADFLNHGNIMEIWPAGLWCLDGRGWSLAAAIMVDDALRNPALYCAAILLLALALFLRRRLLRQTAEESVLAEKSACVAFGLTMRAFFAAIAAALALPAVLAFVFYRLSFLSPSDAFVQGVISGLGHVALLTITLEFVRHIIRSGGLGKSHYGWSASTLRAVRKHLVLVVPWALVFVFLFSMFEWSHDPRYNDSLGRLAFIAAMVMGGVLGHLLFRPGKGPLSIALVHRFGQQRNFTYLSYAMVLAVPLVLIALTVIGYYYTAVRLAWRFHGTILFGFAVLVIHGLIARWLLIARRRLAKEQARKRREALKPQATEGEIKGQAAGELEQIDLAKVDARTQSLVRWLAALAFLGGMWGVWADVLPALQVFDEVHLWQTMKHVSETVLDEEGNPVVTTEERVVWITLRHLGLAFLTACVTWILVRNLPDLLEIALLQRLPLATGERYAVTTIVGYSVLVIGVILTFGILGVGWSKVQWLVAALGVGLGFGLQEIFANFVSGLIILFEQPIRVGDTVTVGGIDGTVSRIRIRATRIIDWNRKELIVPNKEFVTGQVINWTLSDQILRLIIPVGIAYGSDTRLANDILHNIAREHPEVLKDPEPQALFVAFGESSLDFELRVFCPSIKIFLRLRHELHMAIDQAFREAGIEIAFPQRDIHIRSSCKPHDDSDERAQPF